MARGNKGKRGTPTRGPSGMPESMTLGSTDPVQPDPTQQDPTAPTQPAQPILNEPAQPVAVPTDSLLPERTPTPTPSRLIPTPHKRQSSADTKTHLAVSQPRSFKNASGLSNSFKANEALIEARLSEYTAIRSTSRSSTPALEHAAALLVEEHLVRRETSANNPEAAISSPTAHSLQGGAITSEIYQWAHNQRTVNTSSPTPTNASSTTSTIRQHRRMNSMPDLQSAHLRNTPDLLTATQLREPGVFRRRFIAERLERAGKPVAFLTRNFIDFLALYGFYGGDIVPEENDDDDDDVFDGTDEEGIEEFSRVGRPGSARRDSLNRGPDDPDAINATESTPLMSNSYHASSGAAGRGPGLVTAPNVKGTSAKKAFFMLMKSFVGTGVLFLPKAFSMGGMAFSIILMVVFGWMTLHCMLLLLETSRSLGGSFGDIGEKLYGPPIRYLVLGSIAVSQAGFACAYYIFISQNLRDLVMLASDCTIILPEWVFILLQVIIYVPLAWVRKIKFFSFTSLIADVFILVGLMYIFYQDLFVLSTTGPSRDIIWFNLESFPIFIGTALFAFEGICLILPIAESMKHPEQFPMVLTLCITFIGTIFIVIGATGYLTFGNAVETIIFLNMPKDSRLVQTLQFFYAIAIILSFPLCVYPSIRITESAIFGLADGKSSMLVKWQKNLMRTIFVIFLAFVAWTGSSHLDKFVSLVGCFACIPLSFIYPSIFHYHITPNPWVKAKDIGIALFGLVALVYTTYITVSQWVGGSPDIPVDRCASRNGGF